MTQIGHVRIPGTPKNGARRRSRERLATHPGRLHAQRRGTVGVAQLGKKSSVAKENQQTQEATQKTT